MEIFPVGTKVLIDRTVKARVAQAFPEGSTSYAFPHYCLHIQSGDRNVAIAIHRVTLAECAR